jgi:hypothetical protein
MVTCEAVVDRNATGFTVKCENSCPVEYSDGCCKTIATCEAVVDRNSTFLLLNVTIIFPSGALTVVVRQLLPMKQ